MKFKGDVRISLYFGTHQDIPNSNIAPVIWFFGCNEWTSLFVIVTGYALMLSMISSSVLTNLKSFKFNSFNWRDARDMSDCDVWKGNWIWMSSGLEMSSFSSTGSTTERSTVLLFLQSGAVFELDSLVGMQLQEQIPWHEPRVQSSFGYFLSTVF